MRLAARLTAALLLPPLAGACGGGSSNKAARSATTQAPVSTSAPASVTTTPGPPTTALGCDPVPAPGAAMSWFPADLPMPPGSYPVEELPVVGGTHRGRFVVPMTVVQFAQFAIAEYPKAGWRLGRGDAERGEAEDGFVRGSQGGAWRVRGTFCDATKSELLVSFVSDVASSPPPSFTPTSAGPTSTLQP